MEDRRNDRYVIDEKLRMIFQSPASLENKTVSEAIVHLIQKRKQRSHLGKAVLLESLFIYAVSGMSAPNYEKLFKNRLWWHPERSKKILLS